MPLTRRTLLKTSAAALAGATLAQAQSEPDWIDAHVHIWTTDTEKYPLAEGFKKENMKPASFTPEELFAVCRPHGVKRIVLIQMSFYKYDNRYMLDAMRQYPGVFGGVAIIDENGPDPKAEMTKLAEAGVRGFRLYANKENAESWATSPGVQAMWTHAPVTDQAMCLLSNADALPAIHGLCGKHPDTRVVIDHFSRIGADGEIREEDLKRLCDLAAFKNVYVKVSAFYALGKKAAPYTDLGPMVKRLRDAYGAERLMWASDCPYQVQNGHGYGESVALIRDRLDFLTAAEKDAILRTTAEKVFYSKPS